ncbi:hypothetical protein PCC6912_32290 [Chlorogloeopsis fritschii PCC 6912]|uniref:Uncharacterized protein n=1 Tax=Chlorogloeopsis fritschii PCC 6912 TaxID=211165 RepID=A0A3S1A474_CHLFR|nr:hypothetical protein PCC6912_32290 [Chlorogloeopsis fritschii PCC 6912]
MRVIQILKKFLGKFSDSKSKSGLIRFFLDKDKIKLDMGTHLYPATVYPANIAVVSANQYFTYADADCLFCPGSVVISEIA